MRPKWLVVLLAVPALSLAAAPAATWTFLKMETRLAAPPVPPPAKIDVCYNYGCAAEGRVTFPGAQLDELQALLDEAAGAEHERAALAQAVGRMYAWAARQTPIGADKAGNYADGNMPGSMDCIDHSTTTTRFLRLLESRGWLRFHSVIEPVQRTNLILRHFSAAIADRGDGARIWAVDSWYADNGKPPLIAQLHEWESADGPN
ncbi:MAG: hypothetical protein OHM77_06230 [Candidatus Nitricoxidivorans perseverans]|uniref:Transglutaminase-like domain-containing protein n=1 Tax=Candidatus Nitricoxidivorans perseverans TaxID=2975601 RepID=A0AA49FN28_9PROT|nr:MAG: hypothetical protein OHM77_06230 [Candidatus Nitricoxidivorans perseverans]